MGELDRTETDRHVADLLALKAASRARAGVLRGTPEWFDAVATEEGIIRRIRAWAGQRSRGH